MIPDKEELAAVYYDTTKTVVQVAQEFGTNRHRIKDWVNKHGLKSRKELGITKRVHDLPPEKIAAALAEYKTVSGAAEALGCDFSVLKNRMNENNIDPKRRKFSAVNCNRCEHLQWCRANPRADQLPCELEATPYAPGGLTVNPSAMYGGGEYRFDGE